MTIDCMGRVMTTEEEEGGDAWLKLRVGKGLLGSWRVWGSGAPEDCMTLTLLWVEGGCLWWSIKLWICRDFMS